MKFLVLWTINIWTINKNVEGKIKMINVNDLYIVNYCHVNCIPFQNIMRLPEKKAFAKAKELAELNPETTAFYRFGDFINYYPNRLKVDQLLYDSFIKLGGKPKERHPLSFVLQGSEYLDNWFGNGTVTKIPLVSIPSESISFTYGDSMRKTDKLPIITKEMLLEEISSYKGSLAEYMNEIEKKYHYVEVQLWDDRYCKFYLFK